MAVAISLSLAVLWQDKAPGTDQFWRTRPPRWHSLVASQAFFLAVFLGGPPFILWLVNGLLMHSTALQWKYGAVELMAFLCPLAIFAGIVSFSRGWYSLISSLAGAALCFLCGMLLGFGARDILSLSASRVLDYRDSLAVLLGVPAVIMAVSWIKGMHRPGFSARAILTGISLAVLPFFVRSKLEQSVETGSIELRLTMPSTPGESYRLEGLPPGTDAIITRSTIGISNVSGRSPFDLIPSLPRLTMQHWMESGFSALRGAPLKQKFPEHIRWYAGYHEQALTYPEEFWQRIDLYRAVQDAVRLNPASGHSTYRMSGGVEGVIVAVDVLTKVPLRATESRAENGTFLHIEEFRAEPLKLRIAFDVRRAGSIDNPVPVDGLPARGEFFTQRFLPVLHFPAVPMAILLNADHVYEDSRSMQCLGTRLNLETEMPLAESICGVRFTPEILEGAELVLCAPKVTSRFHAQAPAEVQTLQPPAATGLEDIFNRMEASSSASKTNIEALRRMGDPAVKAMLARSWKRTGFLNEIESFRQLWPRWLTDDHLPQLAEAILRDYRWMTVAWQNGQADKLTATALTLVRGTRAPLPVTVLAAAAVTAQPADYTALDLHVRSRISDDPHLKDRVSPSVELWKRLRKLPGFDWAGAAVRSWQDVLNEQTRYYGRSIVPALAALSGETGALDWLLDTWEPGEKFPSATIQEEWAELTAMVEGIPANPIAREGWLKENRGRFRWNPAERKYFVQEGKP